MPKRLAAECADIEALHVTAGLWVDEHLAPDALVATHDAGAIRFFGQRPVLDVWGNHSKELTGLERERGQAAAVTWLASQRPDALVVFPALYARGHSPEFDALQRSLPPAEAMDLAAGAEDYARLFGLTRRAATFHVDAPATVPHPTHADLAVFVRP